MTNHTSIQHSRTQWSAT